jgi:DNA-binding transcriptional ArsR family regulator
VAAEPRAQDPFAALGDPNRRAIIELLSDGERSVQEISEELPISRPAVSRHLKLLRDAGLVADRADGTRRIHGLRLDGVEAIQDFMTGVWGEAAQRFSLVAENTERPGDGTD